MIDIVSIGAGELGRERRRGNAALAQPCERQVLAMKEHDDRIRSESYLLFDTAVGTCGIAWSACGVSRLQLPERDTASTEQRLSRRGGMPAEGSIPPVIAAAICALQRHLAGRQVDLTSIEIDVADASPFHQRVWTATRSIGWGETATYGRLAEQVGSPGAARAIGQAMARNPMPIIVPCHRVLASGGKAGGFSAFGGLVTKERLLALEGVELGGDAPLLDLMKAADR